MWDDLLPALSEKRPMDSLNAESVSGRSVLAFRQALWQPDLLLAPILDKMDKKQMGRACLLSAPQFSTRIQDIFALRQKQHVKDNGIVPFNCTEYGNVKNS